MLAGFEAVPRYGELVARLLGEEVDFLPPGIVLEQDRPEWKFLKREINWTTGRISIAASPANLGRVQVDNPIVVQPGQPGRIVVVTHVRVRSATVSLTTITIDAAAAGTPTQNIALDTRVPLSAVGNPAVSSRNLIANGNAVVSGYIVDEIQGGITALYQFPNPHILVPGHNITAFHGTVNETYVVYFYGYERPARPEELGA